MPCPLGCVASGQELLSFRLQRPGLSQGPLHAVRPAVWLRDPRWWGKQRRRKHAAWARGENLRECEVWGWAVGGNLKAETQGRAESRAELLTRAVVPLGS